MKTLIAYFSRNGWNPVNGVETYLEEGNTKKLAKKIKALTDADIFEIVPVEAYPNDYNECVSRIAYEDEEGVNVEFVKGLDSIEEYDCIYLGFPIWYRTYPRIIQSFIKAYDFTGKKIKPFCTNEEGTFGFAESVLKYNFKNSNLLQGYAVRGYKVNNDDPALAEWIKK
ncbi:MAG: flavodoxin [Bacilli bacterium]|nr:flavodoxin [Bacilli bacterium]